MEGIGFWGECLCGVFKEGCRDLGGGGGEGGGWERVEEGMCFWISWELYIIFF